jgi:hypothetical protein
MILWPINTSILVIPGFFAIEQRAGVRHITHGWAFSCKAAAFRAPELNRDVNILK